jgi:hypothetical protein
VIWISLSCDKLAHEVSRELLNRHRGHDFDHGQLGVNNDSSVNSKPGPNSDYTLRILFVLIQLRGLCYAALIIIT